jgi:hypothetical protein
MSPLEVIPRIFSRLWTKNGENAFLRRFCSLPFALSPPLCKNYTPLLLDSLYPQHDTIMDGGCGADVVISEAEETLNMDLDRKHETMAEVLSYTLVLETLVLSVDIGISIVFMLIRFSL